jgi:hypothetical protein
VSAPLPGVPNPVIESVSLSGSVSFNSRSAVAIRTETGGSRTGADEKGD